MQLLLEELSQLLAEEYRLYESLFALSGREQQCLVANDTDGLDRSLTDIREVIARVQAIGERRQLTLGRLSEQTGIPLDQLTLKRLVGVATGMTGVRLERLQRDFKDLMGRLHKLNGSNLLLIRNSLDMNDRTVRLILGETGRVQFYGDAGQAENFGGPRLVSRRM